MQLQATRGCKKPGSDFEMTGQPFVYTSPVLQDEADKVLRECPVGYTIREARWVYDAIDLCSAAEYVSPTDLATSPRYYRHALRLYQSETARLREIDRHHASLAADARHAAQVLKG